jgi:hypothetical protein
MRTSRHGYKIALGIRFTASFFNSSRARFRRLPEAGRVKSPCRTPTNGARASHGSSPSMGRPLSGPPPFVRGDYRCNGGDRKKNKGNPKAQAVEPQPSLDFVMDLLGAYDEISQPNEP